MTNLQINTKQFTDTILTAAGIFTDLQTFPETYYFSLSYRYFSENCVKFVKSLILNGFLIFDNE